LNKAVTTLAEIKTKLHGHIERSDEKLLKMMHAFIIEYKGSEDIDRMRKEAITKEREKYFAGKGRSYSWNEIKNMAKGERNNIDL
jgi:hypothetical protein